jgi:hypothetical protein
MAVIDSSQKEIQMNKPAYRGSKRLYKMFKNNRLVWEDRHNPQYSYTGVHSPESIGTATVTQTESVPYSVTYTVRIHGYWTYIFGKASEGDAYVTLKFNPGETGTKSGTSNLSGWIQGATGYGTDWARMGSIVLGNEV